MSESTTVGASGAPLVPAQARPCPTVHRPAAYSAPHPVPCPSPRDLAGMRRVVPGPRVAPEERSEVEPSGPVRDLDRAKVLLRYARLMTTGRPIFCKPSRAELAGTAPRRQGVGADGKVIYPDRESAEAAARELEELGARAQRAYVCKRSRRGHYHLTTDLVRERQRELDAFRALAAIPRQQDRRSA